MWKFILSVFFPLKKKKKKLLPLTSFPTLLPSLHSRSHTQLQHTQDGLAPLCCQQWQRAHHLLKEFFLCFCELFIILLLFELYNFPLPVGGLFFLLLLLVQLLSFELFGLLLQTEHQSMGMQKAFITCICLCGTFLLAESWQASRDTNAFFKTLSQSHGTKPAAVHLPGNDRGPTLSDLPNEGHAGKIILFFCIHFCSE